MILLKRHCFLYGAGIGRQITCSEATNRFKIIYILRRVYDKVDIEGVMTHWDVIDVMARKKF